MNLSLHHVTCHARIFRFNFLIYEGSQHGGNVVTPLIKRSFTLFVGCKFFLYVHFSWKALKKELVTFQLQSDNKHYINRSV